MFRDDEITIEIAHAEQDVMLVEIGTPVGVISIVGNVSLVGRVLHVGKAHVDGPSPGVLGRGGLNAIGRKLLKEADANQIVIEGGTRSTGLCKGRVPKIIRFPHP